MFAGVAVAAEYELEPRAERQAQGIAAARRRQAEGRMLPGKKHIGRPKVTGPAEIATLRRLVADGASVTQARPHHEDLPLHRIRRARQHTLTRSQPQPRITKAVFPQVRSIP